MSWLDYTSPNRSDGYLEKLCETEIVNGIFVQMGDSWAALAENSTVDNFIYDPVWCFHIHLFSILILYFKVKDNFSKMRKLTSLQLKDGGDGQGWEWDRGLDKNIKDTKMRGK